MQDNEVGRLIHDIEAADSRLDVLANIAGGFYSGPVDATDAASWHRMIDLNATTAFLCCRHAVPLMKRRSRGRIVNVASGPAVNHGAANLSAYAAAKAAVLNLTESLAKELVAHGITVNALVPTVIDTEANRRATPTADTTTWLAPDDIAAVIEFLASAAAQIVTGSAVCLSKG
jgi:NAD(P)-dependent dehydrogenase (short-subunit alcohol dehydrogenase family)